MRREPWALVSPSRMTEPLLDGTGGGIGPTVRSSMFVDQGEAVKSATGPATRSEPPPWAFEVHPAGGSPSERPVVLTGSIGGWAV